MEKPSQEAQPTDGPDVWMNQEGGLLSHFATPGVRALASALGLMSLTACASYKVGGERIRYGDETVHREWVDTTRRGHIKTLCEEIRRHLEVGDKPYDAIRTYADGTYVLNGYNTSKGPATANVRAPNGKEYGCN